MPGGGSGVAATTGKTKWYEWVGYAGVAAAAVGLALVTAGATVPTTVCFAAGALAGGISAAGHLADTAQPSTNSKKIAKDMRWQMAHKNQQLLSKGEPPRFPDLDTAVKQGIGDLAAATERGYPYGFKDKVTFDKFCRALKAGVANEPTPAGGIPVPTSAAAIQGSAVYRPIPGAIDIALLVNQEQFDKLIEQSFAKEVTKVRSRVSIHCE